MKKLVLTLFVSVAALSACGEKSATSESQKTVGTVGSEIAQITPPKARMNMLIGRSLAIQKAMPAQMEGTCDTVAKIRKNKKDCRAQINAIARTANFKPKDCGKKAKVVTCKGIVETKIGSARVVATFQKDGQVWGGKVKNIVDGTWKRKTKSG